MHTEPFVYTMLCCNNPNNGNDTGRLYALEIDDCLELECRVLGWSPVLSGNPGALGECGYIRIGGYKLACCGYKTWVGNWCWDGCFLSLRDLFHLFNSVRARQWFNCSSGEQRLYNIWESGGKFDINDKAGTVRLFEKYAKVRYRNVETKIA